MKELEERIWGILNSRTTSSVDVLDCHLIAKEVKDIAIEFGEHCFIDYADQDLSFSELFDQFIKEKYGTP